MRSTRRHALSLSQPSQPGPAHPLRSAQWIWPGGQLYIHNTYAQFRKDFRLPVVPRRAPFFISADQSYRLWVNGRYVCRGPARGYQSHWPYDEVDLRPFLRRGHNWISVLAYNPGVSTFQYRHVGMAGMICAGQWGRTTIASDRTWTMRQAPGVTRFTARCSLQLAFQEHVSAEGTDRRWIELPDAALRAWDKAPERETTWDSCFAYGRPPYDTMEPRGIPLMAVSLVPPRKVVCEARGPCRPGYRDWENVSWEWVREMKGRQWQQPSMRSVVSGRWCSLTMPRSGRGRWRSVTLDAGEYRTGSLAVEARGAAGGEILDFHFHEQLVDGGPGLHAPGSACHIALANRLKLGRGTTRHEFFHGFGFRYVTVVERDSTRALRLRLTVRNESYPFTMHGGFVCSDRQLNAIHAACRRTQRVCSLDSYVDTPWREQAQWWGDARIQAWNTFYLDGDPRLLARGIGSIAGQSTTQGLTYGHAPTVAYNCILPDFSLTWILTIWDHYWQTGGTHLLVEQWPRVQQVLAYFDTPEARAGNGLLRNDRRLWYFGDWAQLYKGEIPTLLNLWYLLALRRLAALLAAANMRTESALVRKRAAGHEARVMRLLFDRRNRQFCGGLDERGRQVDHVSVHDQVMALALGLAPATHRSLIERCLLPWLRGGQVPARGVPSAFWSAYALEEMGRRGYAAECTAFIRRHWAPMAASGTTWEGFEWRPGSGSISHAWSAHPCWHFVNMLAGIRQTAPGWRAVEIAPSFVPGIDSVQARVPSPLGSIDAAWSRTRDGRADITVNLPAGVSGTLRLPGAKRSLRGPCRTGVCVAPGES